LVEAILSDSSSLSVRAAHYEEGPIKVRGKAKQDSVQQIGFSEVLEMTSLNSLRVSAAETLKAEIEVSFAALVNEAAGSEVWGSALRDEMYGTTDLDDALILLNEDHRARVRKIIEIVMTFLPVVEQSLSTVGALAQTDEDLEALRSAMQGLFLMVTCIMAAGVPVGESGSVQLTPTTRSILEVVLAPARIGELHSLAGGDYRLEATARTAAERLPRVFDAMDAFAACGL
jgi:hypothetical protein